MKAKKFPILQTEINLYRWSENPLTDADKPEATYSLSGGRWVGDGVVRWEPHTTQTLIVYGDEWDFELPPCPSPHASAWKTVCRTVLIAQGATVCDSPVRVDR